MEQHDLQDMHSIYSHYVKETPISFEYEVPSIEDWKNRFTNINQSFPGLVCLENDKVIGYAYASRLHARIGYSWTAESTIYLHHENLGKGIGKRLYAPLLEILQMQGFTSVIGTVTMPNEKSERLHLSLDFEVIGTMNKVGQKFGNWYDVKYFQLFLNDTSKLLNNFPTPFSQIANELLTNILKADKNL